jgi:hypothetical protein
MIALLTWTEFLWLPPICLAIALVTSAAHREDMKEIVRHGMRSWLILMLGIFVFANGISFFFEWILPG